MFEGAYPPGVTGRMIDDYFGDNRKEAVPACANCIHYDCRYCSCTKEWNNLDESYYIPGRDDVDENHVCDDYEFDYTMED